MQLDLTPEEDYCHNLQTGEHEALYFGLTPPDGNAFVIVRALLGHGSLLEMVALQSGGQTWAYHTRQDWPAVTQPTSQLSGPGLRLACTAGWNTWQMGFDGQLQAVHGGQAQRLSFDLTFRAINAPARYRFGAYQQSEQEGQVEGALQFGSERWQTFVAYRDHSWGQRPMGASAGWTVLSAPNRLYTGIVNIGPQLFCLGRILSPDGQWQAVVAPRLTPSAHGWQVDDPAAGLERWQVRRSSPPIVAYLGQAGYEEVRSEAQPGDLLHDEAGPAWFSLPDGETVLGFMEQARKVNLT